MSYSLLRVPTEKGDTRREVAVLYPYVCLPEHRRVVESVAYCQYSLVPLKLSLNDLNQLALLCTREFVTNQRVTKV